MLPKIKLVFSSLHFIFNEKSAFDFLNKIKSLNVHDEVEIETEALESSENILLQIFIIKEDDFIFYNKDSIKLWITEEMREYIEYKLREFLSKGDFYPAEVGSFQRTNSIMLFAKIKMIDLYFIKEI
ncbi:hypothetical protein [Flavobacterium ginsenosidimutans]|uniref:hypothetical protein n=1 Tax=Flavobacterium ginsenosidimutans TaxID=687844 RepID=UPI000DABB446|nr:hypothetical protein [Flavobacterium ginsenosidimutans]KAF2337742.1 hypothetical protein DM444_02215 [Flavobacterium ginsenosidimutans]